MQVASTSPPAQDAARASGELLYPITPELRSELRLDLRYLLRDAARARALPLLKALNQTLERELSRIRFPREALKRLADEIDGVTDGLPEKSPLLDLSLKARSFARAAAFEEAEKARTGPHATLPPPAPGAPTSASGPDDVMPMPRSASEEAMLLKRAAAAIEVSFVTTAELDESALAGYLNYCMTLENYDAVIGTLGPRVERLPKVWSWNLLLAAMRLSKHPEFTVTAARFHAWLETRHPEALNLATDTVDQRRFSTQKLRILEERELGLQ